MKTSQTKALGYALEYAKEIGSLKTQKPFVAFVFLFGDRVRENYKRLNYIFSIKIP